MSEQPQTEDILASVAPSKSRERFDRLVRRAEWLTQRIAGDPDRLRHDKAELSALNYVMELLTKAERDGFVTLEDAKGLFVAGAKWAHWHAKLGPLPEASSIFAAFEAEERYRNGLTRDAPEYLEVS